MKKEIILAFREIIVSWFALVFAVVDFFNYFLPNTKLRPGYLLMTGLFISAVVVVFKKNRQLEDKNVKIVIEKRVVGNYQKGFALIRNDGKATLSQMKVTARYSQPGSASPTVQTLNNFYPPVFDPARTSSFSTTSISAGQELVISVPTVTDEVLVTVTGIDSITGREVKEKQQM
ncbi:hypothetical protein A3F28_02700 [Candidatus Uhrbacteria bacterium RIFCSPHIGHO2_12_FULL_57_11]|uniref:Uncharacterized protein n=3 Tax=Parcubacteria group TaxID=1794811 RepID=A0A1F7UGW3_9BACT|nr:MAG: hypothetical protein A2704_04060 [Candidatus Kaiserbacteria bacterium RIFCSPHIGHO2_01_FULL_54_36b]OGL73209.1 MAG: hypothetical protein A3D72_04450 [Candidatus Uhrbacteria bacterium RIFCSPHIGHO2_02_FULL_57_19]OGL77540.1 MAG: hypothetical protein A3F28_02700 [Candidatus Uhrbacteria bacterium RIFCSPHIGHO2_12_FULL_57_11]